MGVKGLGYEAIWGVHPVLEFLRSQPDKVAEVSILQARKGPKVQEIIDLARSRGIRLRFVDSLKGPAEAGKINHQGVLARIVPVGYTPFEQLLDSLALSASPVVLVLDGIQDPHNLGAIVRSAAAAGAAGLVTAKERACPLTGTVLKASAGALVHTPVSRVTNIANALTALKKAGLWIFGAVKDAPLSLYQTDLKGGFGLVIGGEEKGIRPLVRRHCDSLLAIPMARHTDSLNASVAAAVILFEACRQRGLTAGQ